MSHDSQTYESGAFWRRFLAHGTVTPEHQAKFYDEAAEVSPWAWARLQSLMKDGEKINLQRRSTMAMFKEKTADKHQAPPPEVQEKPTAPLPDVGETLPATRQAGGVPDWLDEASKDDVGKGVSTSAADNIVPMMVVLHFTSPQVDDANPAYIKDARAGDVWMRNSNLGVVKGGPGGAGFLFQHCHFEKAWPEWIPRGRGGGSGVGFVARHKNREATRADVERFKGRIELGEDIPNVVGADFSVDPKNRQKKWTLTSSGNDLILTRYHSGYVVADGGVALPYVIPFKGSGHAVSKSWMFTMMSRRRGDGTIMPAWSRLYRLTTRLRTNTEGKWFQIDVADVDWVDKVGYARGKALNEAFETGAKVAEAEVERDEGAAAGGGGAHAGGDVDVGDGIPY